MIMRYKWVRILQMILERACSDIVIGLRLAAVSEMTAQNCFGGCVTPNSQQGVSCRWLVDLRVR